MQLLAKNVIALVFSLALGVGIVGVGIYFTVGNYHQSVTTTTSVTTTSFTRTLAPTLTTTSASTTTSITTTTTTSTVITVGSILAIWDRFSPTTEAILTDSTGNTTKIQWSNQGEAHIASLCSLTFKNEFYVLGQVSCWCMGQTEANIPTKIFMKVVSVLNILYR